MPQSARDGELHGRCPITCPKACHGICHATLQICPPPLSSFRTPAITRTISTEPATVLYSHCRDFILSWVSSNILKFNLSTVTLISSCVYNCRFGAFLSDVALFDTQMFGVSAAEASLMDPQQRLLLEATAEVLLQQQQLGRSLGVYVGIASSDYGSLVKGHTGAGKHRK